NVHSIFSSKSSDATNDKPTSVNAFFDHLSNIKDPIQFIKVLETFGRLKQLTFVREELRLQPSQHKLVAREHQELLINLYRQLFGLSKYYNIENDLTASEVINSLLQQFIPDELLDQLQSHLPSPDDIIAPRKQSYHELFNARIYDVGTSRRDYIALTGCILWAPLWFWSFLR
ncbi:14148_t:CDS:2, partial [Dentiscutata heterogama]